MLRRIHALAILTRKLTTALTNAELATEFQCAESSINRNLRFAMDNNLLKSLETRLIDELMPLAHSAIVEALKNNDSSVALELFKGVGLLKKHVQQQVTDTPTTSDDLEVYIRQKRQPSLPPSGAPDVPLLSPVGHLQLPGLPQIETSLRENHRDDWLPSEPNLEPAHPLGAIEAEFVGETEAI